MFPDSRTFKTKVLKCRDCRVRHYPKRTLIQSQKVLRLQSVEVKTEQLEVVVQQIGEAVLATTETIERMANRVDVLTTQVQQQGYQIFALSDAVQTLVENQEQSLQTLNHLTSVLQQLVARLDSPKVL
jgi:ABC-type transporter Mla subunit MlaD